MCMCIWTHLLCRHMPWLRAESGVYEARCSATRFECPLSMWHELEPVGWLPYVVGGLAAREKGGGQLVQVMRCSPTDPTGRQYRSSRDMELIEIGAVFREAMLRPFDSDPRLRTPITLGSTPFVWGWFPAWRWAHAMVGNPMARRVSLYCWPMRENPSGAAMYTSSRGRELFVRL